MNTREILEGARDLIRDPDKWCQVFREYDGKHCIVGAVEAVDRGSVNEWSGVAYEHPVVELLSGMLPHSDHVAYWQDSRGRHHAEVIELLNLAIANEIAREESDHSRHMDEEVEREAAEDPAAPMVFA